MELDLFCFLAEMETTQLFGYLAVSSVVIYLCFRGFEEKKRGREEESTETPSIARSEEESTETPSIARSEEDGFNQQLDEIHKTLKIIRWQIATFGVVLGLFLLGVIKIGFVGEWWVN